MLFNQFLYDIAILLHITEHFLSSTIVTGVMVLAAADLVLWCIHNHPVAHKTRLVVSGYGNCASVHNTLLH